MTFEYSEVKTCLETIDVDDIGNCCLMSKDELEQERYLIVQTILGETVIVTYGPIVHGIDMLPPYIGYTYTKFDFAEGKIIKTIKKFCLEANHVEITTLDYIRSCIINPIDVLEEFPDTSASDDENEDELDEL